MKRLFVMSGIVLVVLTLSAATLGGSAFADDPTVNVTIGQGTNGDPVGTGTLTRSLLGDGTETIDISLVLTAPGASFGQVHVCVSDSPFTSRIPPGQCEFGFENLSGTTFDELINIGTSHVGEDVCLQIHSLVVYEGERETQTAYADWKDGDPFYGSVCIPAASVPVPIGAIGAVGVAGFAGVALAVRQLRRRRLAS